MKQPSEIIKDIVSQRDNKIAEIERDRTEKGLFQGLKGAMAQMLAAAVREVKKHTFSIKVENQIKLPDVQKVEDSKNTQKVSEVVAALSSLSKSVESLRKDSEKQTKELSTALKPKETDLSPVVKAVKDIKIPETKIPKPVESVTVKNLDELKKPLAELAAKLKIEFPTIDIPEYPKTITVGNLEAIESLLAELSTKTEQLTNKEYPQVNLEPLIKATKNVQQAIDELVFPIPTFSIPKTLAGNVAVEETSFATKITTVGDVTYIANAPAGSAESAAVWQAKKINAADGVVITWANGDTKFDNVATDLTALSYS